MFQKPTVADLRQAAQKLGMNPSDAYLNAVEQIITPLANAYATLDTTPDDLPAVKYPRGQFYRPSAEENPHGAWYAKTAIKGKSDGKLAGRRVALKDNICLAGVPLMNGASTMEGYVPDVDATVVRTAFRRVIGVDRSGIGIAGDGETVFGKAEVSGE